MTYLLFAGEAYYAKGGMNDFQGAFHDVASAKLVVDAAATATLYGIWEWWHIICQETLDVVERSDYQAHGCDEGCYVGEGEQ